MNNNLFFDFSVNKENKTINVKREFAANIDLVWKAWTSPELLDQWWAPKPYKAVTKSMNFTEGGRWHYYMLSSEGEKHWCLFDFRRIMPKKGFSGLDAFCDEDGNISETKPRCLWENAFSDNKEATTVFVEIHFNELSDLETIIEMGFKEGFTMGLSNLDELLETLLK